MESEFGPEEALRQAERAEASPYVNYPPTPGWYPPAAGAWFGAAVATIALIQAHYVVGFVLLVALMALLGAFTRWYQRYHGAMPSLRRAPREFRVPFVQYAVGVVVVVALTVAAWTLVAAWSAVLVAGVATALALALYERVFAEAARRTRDRLA